MKTRVSLKYFLNDCPDDLENEYYVDFETGYVNVDIKSVMEDDDSGNYTSLVSNSNEEELIEEETTVLKNEIGKIRKGSQSRVMRYHKNSELEDPELYSRIPLQLHMPWKNEEDLKTDCSTYAEKFEFVKDDIMRNIENVDAFYGKFDLDDLLDEDLDGVDHDLLDRDADQNGPR